MPWVYDTSLELDAIYIDILRPKRPEAHNTPHIKVDTNLANVGNCNVSYDLVVDGTNVLNELALRAPKVSPTFTGTTTCNSLAVSGSSLDAVASLTNAQLNGSNSYIF